MRCWYSAELVGLFGRPQAYTVSMAAIDISILSPEERLELLGQLWQSLAATPDAIPLTDAQREELDRRLDDLEQEGPVGISWEEVVRRIRSREQ